jgi:hypothetical protein
MNEMQTLISTNAADYHRMEHTAVRLRMLEGPWEQDITRRLNEKLTPGRLVNLGRPTQSLNLFQSATRQIAVQHDEPCGFSNPALTTLSDEAFRELVSSTHLHSILQKNTEYVVGLRENLIRIDQTANGVKLHIATPNTITIETVPGDPNGIVVIREMTNYLIDGEWVAAWAIWDISNPLNPHFRVEDGEGNHITNQVVLMDEGQEAWIWFDPQGNPFLPWVRYRAQYTCNQWDAYTGAELAHASIDCAILWTAWNKVVLDASWAQRWVIDLMIQGLSQTSDGTATLECDPTSIIALKSGNDKTGSTGQWEPGADPEVSAKAILQFQSSVLSNIGIHPADIEASTNAQSGIAIQLKRSAQRRLASRMIPQFRAGDTELVEKMAMIYNMTVGEDILPINGWSIAYHLPAASTDEFIAELDRDTKLISLGFISKVDLMMKYNPELSRDQAIERLKLVAEDNALFDPKVL